MDIPWLGVRASGGRLWLLRQPGADVMGPTGGPSPTRAALAGAVPGFALFDRHVSLVFGARGIRSPVRDAIQSSDMAPRSLVENPAAPKEGPAVCGPEPFEVPAASAPTAPPYGRRGLIGQRRQDADVRIGYRGHRRPEDTTDRYSEGGKAACPCTWRPSSKVHGPRRASGASESLRKSSRCLKPRGGPYTYVLRTVVSLWQRGDVRAQYERVRKHWPVRA
jgi:hypothetical protein